MRDKLHCGLPTSFQPTLINQHDVPTLLSKQVYNPSTSNYPSELPPLMPDDPPKEMPIPAASEIGLDQLFAEALGQPREQFQVMEFLSQDAHADHAQGAVAVAAVPASNASGTAAVPQPSTNAGVGAEGGAASSGPATVTVSVPAATGNTATGGIPAMGQSASTQLQLDSQSLVFYIDKVQRERQVKQSVFVYEIPQDEVPAPSQNTPQQGL
jgi:hypothetical protein